MRDDTPQGPVWVNNLRKQMAACWFTAIGSKDVEEIIVEIRLLVSKNREVISATIVDQWRYRQDSRFRKAADSTLQAFKQPECKTLNLEPDKYEMWKDMVVTFDPREML